jgi:ribonucleotide reductase alpha subunit
MFVTKRNGSIQKVSFEKIANRIKKQCYELDKDYVDFSVVAQKVINGLYDGVSTKELDVLAAETAASLTIEHPDYSYLAARIAITSLYKEVPEKFSDVVETLYNNRHNKTGELSPLISKDVYDIVKANKNLIDETIIHDRDEMYDYFGFQNLASSYLIKTNGKILERPQHLYMRISLGIWGDNLEEAFKTYELLSQGYFTHASPTMFNAGTNMPQLASCFLLDMEDSMKGIYKTLSDVALISKAAGGIGLNISNIRAKNSIIKSSGGTSDGIIPMLRVFNETARYSNQNGKRKGSFAMYIEPWHRDIFEFLDLKKNMGQEELRTRDLFLALWIPDLFMKRLEQSDDSTTWTLFSPDEAPELNSVYGDEFEQLYLKYESEGNGKQVSIRELWSKVLESQIETGVPYITFKDHVNNKSMQKNIGIIKSSNLCLGGDTEILTHHEDSASKYLQNIKIKDLVGKKTNIWDGQNWTEVEFKKIEENAKTIKIKLKTVYEIYSNQDGWDLEKEFNEIVCTPEHKFYKENGEMVLALDLKEGDLLELDTFRNSQNFNYLEAKVVEVSTESENQDVYCCTVPTTHKFALSCGIMSGNCNEVILHTNKNETAVCVLSSVALPKFVSRKSFNHDKLFEVVYQITKNLEKTIDVTYYPIPEAEYSEKKHRPIAIGVQGLADTFAMLNIPFESEKAKELNKEIYETIYFAALSASKDLAKEKGAYETFQGSPFSQGLLQWHLWGLDEKDLSDRHDWVALVDEIKQFGVRNSTLTAQMPTAGSSSILGNSESMEPFTSNMFVRRVLSGEFVVVNKHLVKDLVKLNLWTDEIKNKIIMENGSVQNIPEIPVELKEVYKTIWEVKQKALIDLSADRGPFIDQTQSLNLYFAEPNSAKLTSAIMHGWKRGLKTGSYYIRSKPAAKANASLAGLSVKPISNNVEDIPNTLGGIACSLDNKEDCVSCSS